MTQESISQPIVVAALYKFVTLSDYVAFREPLLQAMVDNGIKGTLLIADEGINGTVSGSREGIDGLMAWLKSDPRLIDIDHKESYCDEQPFYRTKVKLKKEIVTLGVEGVDPNKSVGTYVEPKDWNDLITDPEVLLIDTRNDYEVSIGTFEGAIIRKRRLSVNFRTTSRRISTRRCTRRSPCSAPVAFAAKKPRAICSARGSRRFTTSRAGFSNTWKKWPSRKVSGAANVSCSTTGSRYAMT